MFSPAPSETSREDMDLDSLDLRDNELDEVVSQPLPMSGEPLFEGVSESASGGGGGGCACLCCPLVLPACAARLCCPGLT